jgi:hypothetical protein
MQQFLLFVLVLLSVGAASVRIAESQTVSKNCIDGRWGESKPGLSQPLSPGLTWEIRLHKLDNFYLITVLKSDRSIIGHFYRAEKSSAHWKGSMVWVDVDTGETFSNDGIELIQLDCRNIELGENWPWWFKRRLSDPVGLAANGPYSGR